MRNRIEDWPTELQGIDAVETLTNAGGNRRVRFCRRSDGMVHFFERRLEDREEDGQLWQLWAYDPISGVYPDLSAAKEDATRLISWLQNSI
jgi:hypothetical protein